MKFNTFKEAANARGFCVHDKNVAEIISEATSTLMPRALRALFSYLILTTGKLDVKKLWEENKKMFCEGKTEQNAINEIERRLNSEDRSLIDFDINVELSMADFFEDGLQFHEHMLISQKMINNLNVEQKHIFNDINETMDGRGVQKDALFYIDGFGGTGKKYLYECLYHYQ